MRERGRERERGERNDGEETLKSVKRVREMRALPANSADIGYQTNKNCYTNICDDESMYRHASMEY